MQLWTEYEGVTIDGAFTLRKLLMPEGRSAFFSTAGTKGEPTVVRLIECHFDEEEILARWRSMEALNHPNFLKFERFGQTEVDGRPVVYAVFETVDGNLAEVLDQGRLEVKDVAQLASSLTAALEVLHTHGFVHEHIEPRNIFATGGVVKLRGDCIREAPEAEEGRAAKRRDVRDLATVLLLALTQRRSIEGVPESATPVPFGQIIRKGLDGTWGLEDIQSAVKKHFGAEPVVPVKAAAAAATKAPTTKAVETKAGATTAGTTKAGEGQLASGSAVKTATRPETRLPLLDEGRKAGFAGTASRKDGQEEDQSLWLRYRWVGAGAVALLLVCLWAFAHARGGDGQKAGQSAGVSQQAATQQASARQMTSQQAGQSTQQVASGAALTPAGADVSPATQPAASHAGWRVIAYTYNRRSDAEKKVSDLAHAHPELDPEVFTPNGHAPFLVSIGGVTDRETARALARRARALRLPHDTYAQNYNH
jgi:hypothetical protein